MADYLQVPGAQVTPAERQFIHDLAAQYNRPDAVLVNIGIMWGCTLWCLRAGAPLAQLYGVDIAPKAYDIKSEAELHAMILEGDSRTLFFDLPIDVLLVDGDHHYDVVDADIKNWVPRVRKGGTLIFHDYSPTQHNLDTFPHLEGVRRAVDELCEREPHWKALTAPDSLKVLQRR